MAVPDRSTYTETVLMHTEHLTLDAYRCSACGHEEVNTTVFVPCAGVGIVDISKLTCPTCGAAGSDFAVWFVLHLRSGGGIIGATNDPETAVACALDIAQHVDVTGPGWLISDWFGTQAGQDWVTRWRTFIGDRVPTDEDLSR